MALLTGWLYYWGRVKFHDLRAEMTNTPCIAFTLLEQVLFSWINNQTTGFKIKSQLLAWIGRLFLAYFFPAVNNDITFFHFPWRLCLWPVTKIFPNWNFTFFFEKKKHVWRDFKKISHITHALNCQNNVTVGIFILINMCFITTIPLFQTKRKPWHFFTHNSNHR